MSSAFVEAEDRVAVTVGEDTIFIRGEYTITMQSHILEARSKLGTPAATLQEFVVGWEGPLFGDRPCTPENVLKLKPLLPILQEASVRINEVMTGAVESPDPKSS